LLQQWLMLSNDFAPLDIAPPNHRAEMYPVIIKSNRP